jgi:hypothetical protein
MARNLQAAAAGANLSPNRLLEVLTTGAAVDAFLLQRQLPQLGAASGPLPEEPHRSFLAALALLGDEIDRDFADVYLSSLG